jgi:hypothetical protein
MKGIIFAGCSFTWGQGLYYYSEMTNVIPQTDENFHPNNLTDAHIDYKNILRFPRLVANHFNTFEVVKKSNGGSDIDSINFIDEIFNDGGTNGKYNIEEIDYIIFQTSQIVRNGYEFIFNNTRYNINQSGNSKYFSNWLIEKKLTYDQWFDLFCKETLEKIKNLFILYENKGIKCRILCWQNDLLSYIKSDDFMLERFITLDQYDSINDLVKQNENMLISEDYINFKTPINDRHPSKFCHQIIAQNIIKHIENEFTTIHTI